jgi:hypothetical protein
VTITWDAPAHNGDEITNYVIKVRTANHGVYAEETAYCDGEVPAIRDSQTCVIPVE